MKQVAVFITLLCLFILGDIPAVNCEPQAISTVKLEAISVDNSLGFTHLRLQLKAKEAGNFEPVIDIKKAAQKSLEYFFIGLSMHDELFWVNLNPEEPFRIINQQLGCTDLGRIMLAADLRLKEDVSEYINPQVSSPGREFWRRLYDKAQELGLRDKLPVETRLWIVPKEAGVYETDNQLFIIKSSLEVRLEPAYLTKKDKTKDERQAELEDFSAGLMQELVLPYLNKRINEAYAYADLREVYHALILAKWYKQKFSPRTDSLLQVVNFSIFEDAEQDYSYTPDEIYQDYLISLKKGEYSFTETDTAFGSFCTVITTRHYFSGGVDFREIRMREVKHPVDTGKGQGKDVFTCDLFFPQNTARPLQYAKAQMELSRERFDSGTPFALVRNLPAISPVKFTAERMQNLDATGKAEQIMLSKL